MKFIDDVIDRFDAMQDGFSQFDVYNAIRSAAEAEDASAEVSEATLNEASLWYFGTRENGKSRWGTFYAPMFEATRVDGTEFSNPDIADLNTNSLSAWKRQLARVKNPTLVARYADVIWDLGNKVAGGKRNCEAGRSAVDAYLRIARNSTDTSDLAAMKGLRRALVVATELNDLALVDNVAEAILKAGRSAPLEKIGCWMMPTRAFAQTSKLNADRIEELRKDLEQRLEEAANQSEGFAAEAACIALLDMYKKNDVKERQRVALLYAETHSKQAQSAEAGVAIAWLDGIARILENEQLTEQAEATRVTMEKRGPEALAAMKTYTHEISIDANEVDEQLERLISNVHAFPALLRLSRNLIPRLDLLRDRVSENEKNFAFYSFLPRTIIGYDGLPVATIGSSRDDLEGRLVEEATREFQLIASFFKMGYQKAKVRFAFTPDSIAEAIAGSSLVKEESREAIKDVLAAFESEDYRKVITVLVPEVEAMLRELLRLLDVPLRKRIRGSNATELKNMGDVFANARVRETLDEDLFFFLKIFFTDKRSYNLRNEVTHGLLPAHGYNWVNASLTIMSLIMLAIIGPHGVFLGEDRQEEGGKGVDQPVEAS